MRRILFFITILCACVICQKIAYSQDAAPPSPPRPTLALQPTLTPHAISAATNAPTPLIVPTSTSTPNPFILPTHTLPPLDDSLMTRAAPEPDATVIGYSFGGRALTARRFGTGDRALMLVGGIHGGWEANTIRLMETLIDHFAEQPEDIPAGMSLIIVPDANPDGFAAGRIFQGRFNGNGVDLNRNWSCDWSRQAFWQQARVNPGVRAFSEPETVALADYVLQERPAAVLFYHSAANAVFAGSCGGDHGSAALSAVLGRAARYGYGAPFSAYPVTGTESDWVNEHGIPSADVELETSYDTEFDRNLRGVLAVMQWLAEKP